jgi:hypothetical protein
VTVSTTDSSDDSAGSSPISGELYSPEKLDREADGAEDDGDDILSWASSPAYVPKSPSLSQEEFPPDSSAVDGSSYILPNNHHPLFVDQNEVSTPRSGEDVAMNDASLEPGAQVSPCATRTSEIFPSAVLAKTPKPNLITKQVQSAAESLTLDSSVIKPFWPKEGVSQGYLPPHSLSVIPQSPPITRRGKPFSPESDSYSQSPGDSFHIHPSRIRSTEGSPYRLKNPKATPRPVASPSQSQSRGHLPSGSKYPTASLTNIIPSTFPSTIFHVSPSNAIAVLDSRFTDTPSEGTSVMAEEQIQDDPDSPFHETAHSPVSKGTAQSTTPTRPLDRPHVSSPDIASSPPLHARAVPPGHQKRPASSPAAPKRAGKRPAHSASVFQFSQDEPVPQDPVVDARRLKREFLRTRSLKEPVSGEADRSKFDPSNMPPSGPKNRGAKSSQPFPPTTPSKIDTTTPANCMPFERTGRCPYPATCPYDHIPNPVKTPQSVVYKPTNFTPTNKSSKPTSAQHPVQVSKLDASQKYPSLSTKPLACKLPPPESSDQTKVIGEINLPEKPITMEILHSDFTSAYPGYNGNVKHFTSMLGKINGLEKDGKLHRSLWDDFVTKHKTDYAPYMLECADQGDMPMLYEKFYGDKIDHPTDMKGVINPTKLRALFPTEARE